MPLALSLENLAAQADLDAHLADTSAAHAASAISFSPTGTIAATDVQAAIAEVASEAGGGTPGVDYPTSATVTLSSADILDLHNTPITVVAAPGAGKFIHIHRYAFDYQYGTTAYVVGDSFYIAYGADVASAGDLYNDISAANSVHAQRSPTISIVGTSADLDNLPLVLSAAGVAITDGDGDIPALTVWYTIEDVPA